MIEAINLGKSFKIHKKDPGFWGSVKSLFHRKWELKNALNEVSFKINEGELVGLVGANGAGKTTIVKLLAGIIHPSTGTATVLGFKPWERKNEFRKQIGLLMGQKAQLWWDLTGADCFLLLREIYQLDSKLYKDNLSELVETLGVSSLLDIQIRRLSLGERMKMELIASLLHRPKVLFLDEPTLGLDLTAQRAIRKFLLDYVEKYKPAVLLTSHYMQDIEELCDRIIIIREGSFVYDGALSAVLSTYAPDKLISLTSKDPLSLQQKLSACTYKLDSTETGAKIHVPRTQVNSFLASVLPQIEVDDITIEEEEIGSIIESIMTKGLHAA